MKAGRAERDRWDKDMAQLFTMPQLGSTMEEGQIVRWLKQEGETVRKGDVLLEIMTDKANMEVEASCDGVVRKLLVSIDETVPILQPIAIIAAADEPIDALLAEAGGGATEPIAQSQGPLATETVGLISPVPVVVGDPVAVAISPRA